MIMLFEARGLVFLGESVLQHEIFKEFACEAKDRLGPIQLKGVPHFPTISYILVLVK